MRRSGAKRIERRRVIDNNKAWRSAETVRREWLARFITRKTPPAGAEALVCAALISGHHSLTRAMQEGHRLLCGFLGPSRRAEPALPRHQAASAVEGLAGGLRATPAMSPMGPGPDATSSRGEPARELVPSSG